MVILEIDRPYLVTLGAPGSVPELEVTTMAHASRSSVDAITPAYPARGVSGGGGSGGGGGGDWLIAHSVAAQVAFESKV